MHARTPIICGGIHLAAIRAGARICLVIAITPYENKVMLTELP